MVNFAGGIDEPIKHVPLSDQQKAECLAIMKRGNPILKRYKEQYGRISMREFRSRLFRPQSAPVPVPALSDALRKEATPEDNKLAKACLRVSLVNSIDPEPLFKAAWSQGINAETLLALDTGTLVKLSVSDPVPVSDGITSKSLGMSDEEWQAVKSVNAVEWVVTQGYMRLVYRLCNKLICLRRVGQNTTRVVDADDLLQAGVMAIQDAIYSFDPSRNSSASGDGTKFMTYLWRTIFRRMIRELAQANDMASLVAGHEKLLAVYYKSLIADPENDGFDEVVARARFRTKDGKERFLTDHEIEILRGIFTHFVRDNEMIVDDEGNTGIEQVPDAYAGIDHDALELSELMDRAQLTDPERDLIVMAMTGQRGYQANWARKYGVTRPAAGQLLRRLCARLGVKPVGDRKHRKVVAA